AAYPGSVRAVPYEPLFGLAPGGVYRAADDLQDHCRQPHALPLAARQLIDRTAQLIVQTKPGRELLREAWRRIQAKGYTLGNVDVTIIAQAPKMLP
ncbi:2-C-methyl-D-erythritol 2,4-cyclodiphosphate synthase, partial [Klebsiella pneumoniae]|uniref:2-C-methyl-D-erythritol 2,4-cyclodiphosphate synthase n=1 Tax=Klebsiella pneumoniae TaxID=573 RepID=UPI00210C6CF7